MMRGAGGTPGGIGLFIVGLAMFSAGMYLLLNSIVVHSGFHMGLALWSFGRFGLTSGAMLLPLAVGIGFIFYSARSLIGWVLVIGSMGAIILGVIMSLQISIRSMTLLEMILLLVMIAGGAGLFAKSLSAKN